MSWVATAVVGGTVVGGYLASEATSDASDTAAQAQIQSGELATEEQRRQFDEIQKLLAPYIESGETALTAQQNLIGLGGDRAQQLAIQQLERSPQYQALVEQGEEGILQNASATGGLRGGNVQNALMRFRPQVLSQLIESQYSKLGGLTSQGQASAAGVGAAGQNTANTISSLLTRSGDAAAQSALTSGAAQAGMYTDIASSIPTAMIYNNAF